MKIRYVEHYINWRFKKGTREQFNALTTGLNDIVPIKLLKSRFDEKELDLVISGLGKYSI